jgi:hypothetical protein
MTGGNSHSQTNRKPGMTMRGESSRLAAETTLTVSAVLSGGGAVIYSLAFSNGALLRLAEQAMITIAR